MGETNKQKMIECVYSILETEGISAVSVRRVCKEVGCNSAILYRQFQNLEHLICIASVKYLEPYLNDIVTYTPQYRNPLELNRKLWENFCRYGFTKPEIFELLFFGQFKDNLMDVMYDYYDTYQEKFSEMDAFSVSFLFNSDIFERDYMFLHRGVNLGIMTQEQAKKISNMEVYLFHGMLQECEEKKYQGEALEAKIAEFMDYMDTLHTLVKNKK